MNCRRMIGRTAIASAFLMAFVIGNLFPSPGDASVDEEKAIKKIIITRDQAIVDGDTIDLDNLQESLHQIGELDITIVGDIGDLEDAGITKKRKEIVKFGGDVRIEEDEKITGAVVVFGGSATIAGTVGDDVVVLGGDLIIEETADIRGSAVCMGGEITRMPGSRVGYQEVSLGSIPCNIMIGPFFSDDHGVGRFMWRGLGLFAGLVSLGLVLLFGAGIVLFFPRALDRVTATIKESPVKSGLVGLLGEILLFPLFLIVSIVLLVSIVGIPFLFLVIPLAILGVIAAFFMGYIGVGVQVGLKIGNRAGMSLASPYRVMVIGVIAILAFDILSGIMGLAGDALWPVQAVFGFIGGLICYLAATVGFGAMIMTRFGTRSFATAREAGSSAPSQPPGGGGDVDNP